LKFATNTGPAAPFSVTGLPANNSSLAAGASATVTVKFAPTATGSFTGQISVNSNAGNAVISLSGTGVAPAKLTSSVTTLAFGSSAVGTHVVKTFTWTNTGGLALTFSAIGAPAAPFAATGLPAVGSTLAPGQTVTMSATFSPTAKTASSKTLTGTSSGGNVSVALTGTGT
jgi:hypothetical protein